MAPPLLTSVLLINLLAAPTSFALYRRSSVQPQGGPVGPGGGLGPDHPSASSAGRDYHLSVPAPQGYKDPYTVGASDHPNVRVCVAVYVW